MVTFDGKKLDIFRMFFINTKLPKYENVNLDDYILKYSSILEGRIIMEEDIPMDYIQLQSMVGLFNLNPIIRPRISIKKFKKLEKLINIINDTINPPKDPERIFNEIKNIRKELDKDIDNSMHDSFIKKIEDLCESGQKDGKDLMTNEYKVFINEQTLLDNGFNEYITEEQMIEVYKNAPRLLRLDWLSHFIRPIPKEVIAKKTIADKLKIFDNYVVLHYDPFKTGTYLEPKVISTKDGLKSENERIQRAKDPILFGVFNGSTRLYYIDDWIDEFCDLTFEQLKGMSKTEYIEKNVYKQMYNLDEELSSKMTDFMSNIII